MTRLIPRLSVCVALAGALLGFLVLWVGGLPPAADPDRRIVVGSAEIQAVSTSLTEELGRQPTPEELRSSVESYLEIELLRSEANARGYLVNEPLDPEVLRATMLGIGRARLAGEGPTEEEARAYHALRPDRFTAPSGEPLEWPEVRERVFAELEAAAGAAADAQFIREITDRHRIAFEGSARRVMAGFSPASFGDAGIEPARVALLDLVRTDERSYQVTLQLPATPGDDPPEVRPTLPTECEESAGTREGGTRATVTIHWQVICPPGALSGATMPIEGLADAGFPVHLEVWTEDGRGHTSLVQASRPVATLPSDPSPIPLIASAARSGLAAPLGVPGLWILLAVAAFLRFRPGEVGRGVLAFAVGYVGSRWFAAGTGPLLSVHLATGFILLSALVPALDLAAQRDPPRSWLRPSWLFGILLGGVCGSGWTVPRLPTWITGTEWAIAVAAGAAGAAVGIAAMGGAAWALRAGTLRLASPHRAARVVGVGAAVATIALLVPRAAALTILFPGGIPRVGFELALFALVLGLSLPALGLRTGAAALLAGTLLAVGGGLDFPGLDRLAVGVLTLGALFLLGVMLMPSVKPSPSLILPAVATATVAFGAHLRQATAGEAALSPALAAGAGLAALLCLHMGGRVAEAFRAERRRWWLWIPGVAAAVAAIAWRLTDYRRWIQGDVAEHLSAGLLPIPVLAMGLLVAAVLLRPRRRRVPEALGIPRRSSRAHWVSAGLAFFLLPVGTVNAANPASGRDASLGTEMRPIVSELLHGTYTAFNLDGEAELYDRLSEHVTDELVPDLYLDSRRRLRAGTQAEDEVTIRSVEIVRLDPLDGTGTAGGPEVAFSARWIVTSRIRHLQHVHDRRTVYDGRLVLRSEDGRWKIGGVELGTADHAVIPGDSS